MPLQQAQDERYCDNYMAPMIPQTDCPYPYDGQEISRFCARNVQIKVHPLHGECHLLVVEAIHGVKSALFWQI